MQFQLAKVISAIVQDRYEQGEMKKAAEVIASARSFPGGLGEAVRAMTYVLIDNGGFKMF